MAALEQIMQMQQQGLTESQIIQYLKEQGISPKEINESLSQSKIKSAIGTKFNPQEMPTIETEFQSREINSMKPSIMPQSSEYPQQINPPTPQNYPSHFQPQETYSKQQTYSQNYPEQQYQESQPYPQNYPEQQPYPEQEYPEEQYYQPSDIETINEIAGQLIDEKLLEIRNEIESITKIKQNLSPEIEAIKQRLEKLENNFNDLQMAILKKVGDYGQSLQNISQEMQATQESFSKMINPVLDYQRQPKEEPTKNYSSKKETHKSPGRPKKTDNKFEDLLR